MDFGFEYFAWAGAEYAFAGLAVFLAAVVIYLGRTFFKKI